MNDSQCVTNMKIICLNANYERAKRENITFPSSNEYNDEEGVFGLTNCYTLIQYFVIKMIIVKVKFEKYFLFNASISRVIRLPSAFTHSLYTWVESGKSSLFVFQKSYVTKYNRV